MADPRGFMEHHRETAPRRPVPVRLRDWREVYDQLPAERLTVQASRCMDCGVPFCHDGCPLGNLIPDWNDLVYRGQWRAAIERLHATNNFPDFTGRLCPAPCEAACVLGIDAEPVAIKQVEVALIDRAWDEGWVTPVPSGARTGRRVGIVGSGPAGLAAAQQLARAGHDVVIWERADRPGGLLRYGIPEFKMEKRVLDRRLDQLRSEGVELRCGVDVGRDLSVSALRSAHDAVILATGATVPRDLTIPGRHLRGIHQAMDYLPLANRVQEGDLPESPLCAAGKRVVIIGGGDTGADCLGTAHRQGAASVQQFEILPRPPDERHPSTPWPMWPLLLRTSPAHEEGGERLFAVETELFADDGAGAVAGLRARQVRWAGSDEPARGSEPARHFEPVPGSGFFLACDLVLLAMGFSGPEPDLPIALGATLGPRGTVDRTGFASSAPGVWVCGDAGRGQSLVVWAIAEGRSCAAAVDRALAGRTMLPSPLPA